VTLKVLPDRATLATAVAQDFVDLLIELQSAGATPHVALTGGTVANEIHAAIAAHPLHGDVDWNKVVFWWGDERFTGPDDEDRNALQARRSLLDVVGATQVHEIQGSEECATVEEAAERYSADLRAADTDRFDLVMLGVGPDGHVASLFPGYPQLDVDDTIAVGVHDSPKPPPQRVSLTFGALNRTARVWFLVSGPEKAGAVARALAPTGSIKESPARGIQAPEITWYLDKDADRAL